MSNECPDDLFADPMDTNDRSNQRLGIGVGGPKRTYQGPVQGGQHYQTSAGNSDDLQDINFAPDWCDSFQDNDIESVQKVRRCHDELADSASEARKEGLRPHRRHLHVIEPDRYAFGGSGAPPPAASSNLLNTAMFILERLATDPYTPPSFLTQLAAHPDGDLRAIVAENRNTPMEVIEMLAKDSDVNVRYQLAENHNISMIVLRSLIDDDNPYVSCRAQQTLSRLS